MVTRVVMADDERDEHGDEELVDEGDAEALAPEPEPRPKPKNKRAPAVADPQAPLSIFGSLPATATHFGVRRRNQFGKFEPVFGVSADGQAEVREWPLSLLSVAWIREHFGPGRYRVEWVGTTERSGRAYLGAGKEFGINELPTAAAPAAASSPAPFDPFDMLTRARQLAAEEERSRNAAVAAQLQHLTTMAAMFAGARPAAESFDMSRLELMLERQRIASQEAMTAAVAPLRSELETMRARLAELEEEEEDDDREPSAALSFDPGTATGDAIKTIVLNAIAKDPSRALDYLGQALALGKAVMGALEAKNKPRASADNVRVIRSVPAAPAVAPAAEPKPASPNASLHGAFSAPPPPPPPEA